MWDFWISKTISGLSQKLKFVQTSNIIQDMEPKLQPKTIIIKTEIG